MRYEIKDLTPQALRARAEQIDGNYAEPRTTKRVALSYKTSMDSISPADGYAALWRGARACAWLAENSTDPSKREAFALKGIAMGREAVAKASARVESHYYLALCYARLADVRKDASRDLLREMRDCMRFACSLNDRFDSCGPHRFLGRLMVETADYPFYAMGSYSEGLNHLKQAAVLCPDYGENHLVYARALLKDGQDEEARAELEKVISSPRPPDRSAEYDSWLAEATRLLRELPGADRQEGLSPTGG